jgi:hypothetical protein
VLLLGSVGAAFVLGGVAFAATPTTIRVSVASSGAQANGASQNAIVSANGRYVAFDSRASNLTGKPDTNGKWDVFEHDLLAGRTWRISIAANGGVANDGSQLVGISADGSTVVFDSRASNLVPGRDRNGFRTDVYVRNIRKGRTKRIDVNSAGLQSPVSVSGYAVTPDGRSVAMSGWPALCQATSPTDGCLGIRDRQTATTSRVPQIPCGVATGVASLSADASSVSYTAGCTNSLFVTIRNRRMHQTLVLRGADSGDSGMLRGDASEILVFGENVTIEHLHPLQTTTVFQGTGLLFAPFARWSADGQNVVYSAQSSNADSDVYAWNRTSHVTTQLDVALTGSPDGPAREPSISADGTRAAFTSDATNLVASDTNAVSDIFVREHP